MTYLDVTPMIIALRTSPSDFEMKRGWLHHFPSRHEFKFDRDSSLPVAKRILDVQRIDACVTGSWKTALSAPA